MHDWLVFVTRKNSRIRYLYFVGQSQSNITACLTAWDEFEREFYEAAQDRDAWALEAYELPQASGAHRIDR